MNHRAAEATCGVDRIIPVPQPTVDIRDDRPRVWERLHLASTGGPSSEKDRANWLECLSAVLPTSPYLHPDVLSAAGHGAARPTVSVRRAMGSGGTEKFDAVAVLSPRPREVRPVPGVPVTFRFREHKLAGDQIAGQRDQGVVDSFIETIVQMLKQNESDCAYFEDVEVGSPLWRGLAGAKSCGAVAVFYPAEPQPHWWLRLPDPAEEYWNKFSHRTRNTLKRRAKKLPHTLRCYREPDRVAEFLAKAHEVSRRSWQANRLGVRIKNDAGERTFWEALASTGAMRSYLLESEEGACAFMLASQWNGYFLPEEIAYDPALAQQAPGTVLLYRIIEDLIGRDTPRLLDFGFGDNDYKSVFGTDQTVSGPVLLVRRGLKPLLGFRLAQFRCWVTGRIRSGLRRGDLITRLRKRFRGKRGPT